MDGQEEVSFIRGSQCVKYVLPGPDFASWENFIHVTYIKMIGRPSRS